jgi:hypothetical protein
MTRIENTNLVIEVAGRWMPNDVAFIKGFAFTAQAEGHTSKLLLNVLLQRRDLCLKGWPAPDVPKYQVDIDFAGVRELQVKGLGQTGLQVTGFDIVDASNRGWEDVGLEIEDYENGRIGFLCATARIVRAAEATPEV